MGTPEFASASLNALLENHYDVVGVFTQPDKAKGRGMEVTFSPVKQLALAHDLPVFQPTKMRDGTALATLQSLKPDLVVVVAYGRILPDDLLAVPPLGTINVHGSLLPQYRGAAPIQWSVLNGDRKTGVTTMYLASEMDAGDIIYAEETEIGEYETSGELYDRLKEIGASLLIRTVQDIEAGTAPRTPQNHEEATYVTMLDKSLSPIDFSKPARAVIKWIYGLQPWPVATAMLQDQEVRIFGASYTSQITDLPPGSVVSADEQGIVFACKEGSCICVTELQLPGKRRMSAAEFLRGHPVLK